jgi:putative oxidoreductase
MDKPLFNLLNTSAPAATLVVRLLPGLVFFAEGIKKFMFPTEWGIGRFEKIGIIYPIYPRRLLASWRLSADFC